GSFSFSMAPNVPYAICLIPCVFVVLSTVFVVEEKKSPGVPVSEWANNFWVLLQKRVMWQICAFRFINNMFQSIGSTAGTPLSSTWAGVEPLNDSLSSIIGNAIFSAILIVVAKWGLHWNWRWTIALGSIGVILVDGMVIFFTIWDVVRNQWFFTGVALADNIPGGVRFIVATYCAVEIADVGNEGATYGLVTTVSNLAGPFASVIYKYIDSYFMLSQDDLRADTTEVRWDVTYSYIISFGCKLIALTWLWMLPPQRNEMQELKKKGGKSKLAGVILIVVFTCCLAFSTLKLYTQDSNVNMVAKSIEVMGVIMNYPRRKFASYARILLPALDLFQLHALPIDAMMDELKLTIEAATNKVPASLAQGGIYRCIAKQNKNVSDAVLMRTIVNFRGPPAVIRPEATSEFCAPAVDDNVRAETRQDAVRRLTRARQL
ncbi:hypothetical protein B5M09_011729, partial [Aphanomyces astaci]